MIQTDIAIVGGGIAGLWLLNVLRERGYSVLLLEKNALGAGQTLASQGMIHGGLKYSLRGRQTTSATTIRSMPGVWNACLSGEGFPDLSTVACLADRYYLFSDGGLASTLTTHLGGRVLEGDTRKVRQADFPPPLNNRQFRGVVYELPDVVLDTSELIKRLSEPHQEFLIRSSPQPVTANGGISALRLEDGTMVSADRYLFCAGSGNEQLVSAAELDISCQLRPLHQVMVKGNLPRFYGHAVSLASVDTPRLTITTHPGDGSNIWYLGGELAETGVSRSDRDQTKHARAELEDIFPYLDFSSCEFRTLRIDRAEPGQKGLRRPVGASVVRKGNVLVCWPTKLTLTPMLADLAISELDLAPQGIQVDTTGMERAPLCATPWENAFA